MEENGLIANLSHLKRELMAWKNKKWKILKSIKNKKTGQKGRKKEGRKEKKERDERDKETGRKRQDLYNERLWDSHYLNSKIKPINGGRKWYKGILKETKTELFSETYWMF